MTNGVGGAPDGGNLAKPQTRLLSHTGERTSDLDSESLVAFLADEAEYWKARAETLDQVIEELAGELDAVHRRAEITEAWRKGMAEAMLDGTTFSEAEPPFRSMAVVLLVSLALWGCLGLLAFAAYSFVAS